MTIFNNGSANPAATGVPGLSVNVQAPPSAPLTGASADILGIVGSAGWGPVNSPVAVSDENGMAAIFAPMANRKYDLGTAVHIAGMQQAANFRLIRQTDGSDTAATGAVQTTGLTLTAKYTGSLGAGIQFTIGNGTKDSTKKATVTMPGRPVEVFDNLPQAAANATWIAIAAAINNGNTQRGPSNLIVAAAGALTAAPTNGTVNLTGGADGAAVSASNLVGSDTSPRTGMYGLRNTGIAIFMLADVDDPTTWATQIAFAKSESAFGYGVTPMSDTISNLATEMVGTDDPWFKVMYGDWIYMLDAVNNLGRYVSPQAFAAGNKVSLGPHRTSLNKPLYGVSGTQKSALNQKYSDADLQLIALARAEVITMDAPGGNYPTCRIGRSTSSDLSRRQETYTTMTNYLAQSFNLAAGVGRFVGRLITPEETREAGNTIGTFLQAEQDAGRIGNPQGTLAYSVVIDNSQAVSGIQRAKVMAQYQNITEYFIVDLTGGATVVIQSQTGGQ